MMGVRGEVLTLTSDRSTDRDCDDQASTVQKPSREGTITQPYYDTAKAIYSSYRLIERS